MPEASYAVSLSNMSNTTVDAGELAGRIKNILIDMDQEIQKTVSGWLGTAKAQYDVAKRDAWAKADAMPAALTQVSHTLDNIQSAFSNAERNVVNTFTD